MVPEVLIVSKEVFEANTNREFKLFRVGGWVGGWVAGLSGNIDHLNLSLS